MGQLLKELAPFQGVMLIQRIKMAFMQVNITLFSQEEARGIFRAGPFIRINTFTATALKLP